MLNVYVAGAARNFLRARAFIERIEAHPRMRVTLDWTKQPEQLGRDEELTDDQRFTLAVAELSAIDRAHVIVVLAEEENNTRGLWVELGYATFYRHSPNNHEGIKIIVSGGARRSIFMVEGVVDLETQDDDAAFARVVRYADVLARGLPLW